MKHLLIGLLKLYRLVVSPLYGNVCRYYPSCSAYALRSVEFHGAVRGTWLAGRRLLRCHPWTPGGYDPVPGTPEWRQEQDLLTAAPSTGDGHAHDGHAHDGQDHAGHDHSTSDHSPVLQRMT